jgi:SpoIID/LytB domain protein
VIFVASVFYFVSFVVTGAGQAQDEVTDAQLTAASRGKTIRLGPAGGGRAATVPLEVYVARVLAGEAEPRAAQAALEALAVAIRTYALFNEGRHEREGFDVCDSTHCQVPRAASAATRRATLATAGRILTYRDRPAELFYSASCGGYSESATEVWPGADYPYLAVAEDDVHDDDAPWVLPLTLAQVDRALERAGFEGRLRDVRITQRNASGRVALMAVTGLVPDVIRGDQFRAALGTTAVRSTAFDLTRDGDTLRLTGRGYGHGVGMCVIGAGRRAARGETAEAILSRYYPGLRLTPLTGVATPVTAAPRAPEPAGAPTVRTARGGIAVRVSPSAGIDAATLERRTGQMHDELSRQLGVTVAPIVVRLHDSLEAFRGATGQPWWVSSLADGTSIDLAPMLLLEQRDGLDVTLRTAVAELLVAQVFADRPRWVRVGAARYFGRPGATAAAIADARCPADAELTLAVSAVAQRDAEARAQACFARQLAKTRDWRAVR